ncbi:ABC-type transport auxiliary lipoprotein family protein [Rhizobium sp. EC-SD404]|uniref:ABC-type transport auxiliary lipoprotein family protein n=1 Tax=Rhizobium sp. EC-SD404 TaxID=2038389 RepID=UPI0012543EC9|nr:ABC-type transport auxiliary lipoprotein family protein [Rhizobium sp. EC-SD404]VVT22948.1 ABC transporter [Rhizobium sp. EC-SD404]
MLKRFLSIVAVAAALSGCAGLPGFSTPNDTFALTSPPAAPSVPAAARRQLLIQEPSALKLLDSEQIVVRVSDSEVQYLTNSQWNDRLPRIVESKLVEAFENTGQLGGVGRSGDGLAIDFQLLTNIRSFEVLAYGSPRAAVELSIRLINDRDGTVVAQRVFTGTAPVAGTGNETYVRSLDAAFNSIVPEIISWTMQRI